jgi:PAS domain S-box-containing protein
MSAAGPYSLLLIEDNPLDAELTRNRLQAGGLQFDMTVVDARANFEECFEQRKYDLILADYSLPDFDGLTALEIVRAREKRLPFIFVSGVLGEEVAVETLLRGATDYVLKQRPERLIPAVTRALAEHAAIESRERAEAELKQVEQRFETLTNSLPAMVWTADRNARLTFVNTEWTRCVGKASGLFDVQVIHPRDVNNCMNAWDRARETGKPFDVDCRYRMQADGSYRWHLVRGIPLAGTDGREPEWVGTCTDTEKQRSREAHLRTTEKLALTGRLSSVIAHEINNPLEALTNIVYLLGVKTLSDELHTEHLRLAEQELSRISAITKQTLQWSREEAVVAEISAESLVEDALKLFVRKMENKSVQLTRHMDATVTVRVVAGELRQVLSNLISNAIDAVKIEGSIDVRVQAVTRADGQWASIEVVDNGCGISGERLALMFQPFQSSKGSLGSGLGMFISKELVERYGGDLVVESEVGKGTTMRILLPLIHGGEAVGAAPDRV